MIRSLRDIEAFLAKHTDYERMQKFHTRSLAAGPERVRRILEALDQPTTPAPTIHITGTKGKGSTAIYTEAILRAHGYRTGLFTSPHLESLRERIQIEGQPVPTGTLAAVFRELDSLRRKRSIWKDLGPPTFFEWLTAAALRVFHRRDVNAIILEVGLGGRFDSTNMVDPVATSITSIGHDHLDKLGPSLRDVGREKAGIIKPGVPLVLGCDIPTTARTVIGKIAKKHLAEILELGDRLRVETAPSASAHGVVQLTATVHTTRQSVTFPVSNPTPHLAENAGMAVQLAEILHGSRLKKRATRVALANTVLPARFEIVRTHPVRVVLDSAHTVESVEKSIQRASELARHRVVCVLGLLSDKDVPKIVRIVHASSHQLILTQPPGPRAVPADELSSLAEKLEHTTFVADPKQALLRAKDAARERDLILVTGSFYLAGSLRKYLPTDPSMPSEEYWRRIR